MPSIHPIIYVRGYAMTQTEIEDTVADPYMGFNLGSCKVRQLWDGRVRKYFFESPLMRLMKHYGYDDVYEEGLDQIESGDVAHPLGYRSIVIYRYYEPSSEDLGSGKKPDMRRFAKGLGDLILALKARMFPKGGSAKPDANRPASPDDFRVYLVAHSMGGLVCRAFLQNPELGDPEARRLVDKVFTYATPHNGIDVRGIGNVPEWLSVYGINTFNRDEIAKVLGLSGATRDGDAVDLVTNFPADRIFNLVGTNPSDYKVAAGLSSFGAGDASDGLVRTRNATTRGRVNNAFVASPHAYVHRSHSGFFGIVNSEEGYQNLARFLFGDIRADGWLEIDELTLPPKLEKLRDEGKKIRASYSFEVVVSIRGKQWQLHRRTTLENSAIFRKYDELFTWDKSTKKGTPIPGSAPMLFNVFLDTSQRTVKSRPTVAFSVDLSVRVPEYVVDGFLFLDDHFEGSYLFRDQLMVEATPPATKDATWAIKYRYANAGGEVSDARILQAGDERMEFEIPVVQPKAPGLKARLRVQTRFWK